MHTKNYPTLIIIPLLTMGIKFTKFHITLQNLIVYSKVVVYKISIYVII